MDAQGHSRMLSKVHGTKHHTVNQSKGSNKKTNMSPCKLPPNTQRQSQSDKFCKKRIPSNPYPRSRKATAASNTLYPVDTEPDTVENTEKKKHIGG